MLAIMDTPNDLITATEARQILGVSRLKLAQLLKEGTLRYFPDKLDKRAKLVSRAEVLELIPRKAEAA
jgi:predicted DNA-binding transcriptional regulator AlpA